MSSFPTGWTRRPAPSKPLALQRPRHPIWLILAASLWMATVSNAPLWFALKELSVFDRFGGWLFAIAFALIIASSLILLVSMCTWRWTLKPILIGLMLLATCGSYFMTTYHVVIDSSMVVNALQTNLLEVRDLMTLKLALSLLVLWVLPSIALWYSPVAYGRWAQRAGHNLLQAGVAFVAIVLLTLASFSPLASTMRNHKELRYLINPLNGIYALTNIALKPFQNENSQILPTGLDAVIANPRPSSRPPLLILVLGETGRSGNFGLNGYERNTTPELMREGVSSFRNVIACGTSTAASVPCMFSGLGRVGYEARKNNSEGLLDVIQRAGMVVLWIDNQSGCKGACDRVTSVNTSNLSHPTLCPGGECYDGIMLEGLEQRIAALPAERRNRGVVVVLHQMGSHGPAYYLRSPKEFKRFIPECTDSDLQSCDNSSLVNAYDNSIAYADHFLASTINWLKAQQSAYDTAMVYVADHGESLGENNLYLHGMPYVMAPDVQKRVPWISWLSQSYALRTGATSSCMAGLADRPLTHDYYFHSVLGLLAIQSTVYRQDLDVYSRCLSKGAESP